MNKQKNIRKGDIYLIDLGQKLERDENRIKPALIIQNDIDNKNRSFTIVAIMACEYHNGILDYGIKNNNNILFEEIITIDKRKVIKKIGKISTSALERLNETAKKINNKGVI